MSSLKIIRYTSWFGFTGTALGVYGRNQFAGFRENLRIPLVSRNVGISSESIGILERSLGGGLGVGINGIRGGIGSLGGQLGGYNRYFIREGKKLNEDETNENELEKFKEDIKAW